MKLFNIFKKENKKATVNIQKMDKTQLEKVVGGTDDAARISMNVTVGKQTQCATFGE